MPRRLIILEPVPNEFFLGFWRFLTVFVELFCLLHFLQSGIRDPLKDLVYRVHPLPESMIDFVFDFGALAPETERY
jgi:hypothetical protein